MYRKSSRFLRRGFDRHTSFTSGYSNDSIFPKYLEKEYFESYQFKCRQSDFYRIVKEEIEECRIDSSLKNLNYKLWFGKYEDDLLFEIEDFEYLKFLRDTFRLKNKKLVGQVLIRMDELTSII